MSTLPITKKGFDALHAELEVLKGTERPAIITAIADAREHGDLKENAEYHSAREKQGFIEGRIAEIEGVISHSEVIDISNLGGKKVVFGATIKLLDFDTDKEVTYQIVGEYESDIDQGKISLNSPVAHAMIGKEVGDEVVVKTPKGTREYEIISIDFIV